MGIKRKKPGCPMRPVGGYERWQELATDRSRTMEAVHAYREKYPNTKLVEAGRAVGAYQRDVLKLPLSR